MSASFESEIDSLLESSLVADILSSKQKENRFNKTSSQSQPSPLRSKQTRVVDEFELNDADFSSIPN